MCLSHKDTKRVCCTAFSTLPFPFAKKYLPISSSGKYSEYKPSWPPEPIGQNKLWKTNRNSSQLPRPPPGLTNQKQASPSSWGSGGPRLARSWGGGGINQESRFGPGTVNGEMFFSTPFVNVCLTYILYRGISFRLIRYDDSGFMKPCNK